MQQLQALRCTEKRWKRRRKKRKSKSDALGIALTPSFWFGFYRIIQLNAELRNFVLSLHLERDNLLLCRCETSEDWLQALIIWFFRNASNRVIWNLLFL